MSNIQSVGVYFNIIFGKIDNNMIFSDSFRRCKKKRKISVMNDRSASLTSFVGLGFVYGGILYLFILMVNVSAQVASIPSSAPIQNNIQNSSSTAKNASMQGAILPEAQTTDMILQAMLSPDPAQSYPQELTNVVERLNSLPHSIRSQIDEFYMRRNYEPLWLKNEQITKHSSVIHDYLNQELYLTTPISNNIFTSVLRGDKQSDFARYELNFTLNLLQKIEFIRNGIIGQRTLGISETSGYKPFSPFMVLNAFASLPVEEAMAQFVPTHPDYAKLRAEIITLNNIRKQGGFPLIPSSASLVKGGKGEAVERLAQRLKLSGDLAKNYQSVAFDNVIENAVKKFQYRHGLNNDGVIDVETFEHLNRPVIDYLRTLLVNIERIRKMPLPNNSKYVRVNIPEFHLKIFDNHKIIEEMKVIIGRDARKTPIFTHHISYIEFNPYWHVPYRLAVEDILPKLQSNPQYLTQKNMKVFLGETPISATNINWKQYNKKNFPYSLRQEPGIHNALGTVKFMFPNAHSVYLHDTPEKNLFDQIARNESSGCVRVSKPQILAYILLEGIKTKQQIDTLFRSGKNTRVNILNPVPISLEYLTASFNKDGESLYSPDIYNYDRELSQKLDVMAKRLLQNR